MKEKLKAILESLVVVKDNYGLEFDVRIVNGKDASIQPNNFIHIGAELLNQISENHVKSLVFHEAFHQKFPQLNQSSLKIISEQRGKPFEEMPEYWESEIETWKKVKEEFPELTSACDDFIRMSQGKLNSLSGEVQ